MKIMIEEQTNKEIEFQEGQQVLIQNMNTSNWEKGRINKKLPESRFYLDDLENFGINLQKCKNTK